MNKFASIFIRGGSLLTFAGLELLCFYFIINYNSAQREIALETYSLYSSDVNERMTSVRNYLDLDEQNERLRNDIAAMMARSPAAVYREPNAGVDTLANEELRQRFTFFPGRVVNKSPFGANNTFVINRGKIHGVEKGQGVITENTIVGIVTAMSARHARVMTLLHGDSRISAGIPRLGTYGSLIWDGPDPRIIALRDVPRYTNVEVGDTVKTMGFSNIFPAGIVVGTVKTAQRQAGGATWDIDVELIANPLRTEYVYVVRDLLKEDLDQLNREEND